MMVILIALSHGSFVSADSIVAEEDQPKVNQFIRFAAAKYKQRTGEDPTSALDITLEMQVIAGDRTLLGELAIQPGSLWSGNESINPAILTLYSTYLDQYLRDESIANYIPGEPINLDNFEKYTQKVQKDVSEGKGAVSIGNPLSKNFNPGSIAKANEQKETADIVGFIQERLAGVVNTMFGLLAVFSLIPIVVGGIQLTISQGGQYAEKGKKTLFWGVIGLIVGFSGVVAINILLDLLIQT